MKDLLSSKTFQTILGLAVSALVIGWLVVSVEWAEVWVELGRVNYLILIPVTAVLFLHFFLRSARWRFLLPASTPPTPLGRLFDAIMVGNFATYILPLRAGEFIRPYMLTLYTSFSFSSCFVSVVIERFFDLSMVLVCFGLMLLSISGIPAIAHQGALTLAMMAMVLFVFMLLSGLMPDRIIALSDRILALLPERSRKPLSKFVGDFIRGASVLNSAPKLAKVVSLTILVWLTCFLQYYLYLFMFDVEPSLWLAVSVAVMIALAVAAPSAPGFVGVYQAGCIAAFALFGIKREVAVAFSILTHVHQFVFCIGMGLYVLLRNNLKLSQLRRQPS